MLRLVLPDTQFFDSYVEAMKEGYNYSSYTPKTEEEIAAIIADPHKHFINENHQGGFFVSEDGKKYKRVPSDKYWLVDGDEFIGACWLRYELNDFLEVYGGHVGYGIRPSKRKQGYGTKMLSLALSVLKEREVTKVLVCAEEENPASCKVIENCGGVLTGTVDSVFHEGYTTRQYWIELKDMCG